MITYLGTLLVIIWDRGPRVQGPRFKGLGSFLTSVGIYARTKSRQHFKILGHVGREAGRRKVGTCGFQDVLGLPIASFLTSLLSLARSPGGNDEEMGLGGFEEVVGEWMVVVVVVRRACSLIHSHSLTHSLTHSVSRQLRFEFLFSFLGFSLRALVWSIPSWFLFSMPVLFRGEGGPPRDFCFLFFFFLVLAWFKVGGGGWICVAGR